METSAIDTRPIELGYTIQSPSLSTELDAGWLASFGVLATDEIIETLQACIDQDTEDLRVDDSQYQQAVMARGVFFDTLGLEYQSITDVDTVTTNARTALQATHATIMPLHTVVSTWRVLDNAGIQTADVINKFPWILGYAPDSVQEKVVNLTNLGVQAADIINKTPVVLSYAPDSVQEKVVNLTNLGVQAADIINKTPVVLSYAPDSVQEKVANLTSLGIQAADVINKFPMILGYAPDSVQEKVANLTSLGIQAADIINKTPVVLSYAPDSVQEKVANLTSLGIQAADVINKFPMILGYAPSKINLTSYALMKHALWYDTDNQIGMQTLINNGSKTSIFTLPVESLLSYLNTHSDDVLSTSNLKNSVVRNYMKNQGATNGLERKTHLRELLMDDNVRHDMGYIAVLYCLKEKIADDYSWDFSQAD